MKDDIIIRNAAVVQPDRVLKQASVLIRGRFIEEVSEDPLFAIHHPGATVIDAKGAYVMPGFIDIHSDNIETVIQPRPQSMIDFELAMREQEKQLVNQGITTMYHSLTIMDTEVWGDEKKKKPKAQLRSQENLKKLVGLIRTFHEGDHLIRHRFHCRYEITNTTGYDMLLGFIQNRDMQLLSFMDHTPGQGQYRDLEFFKNNVMGEGSDEEKEALLQKRMHHARLTQEQIAHAADLAAGLGIPIASHDDDSLEKLDYVTQVLHAGICEFPIELPVAQRAHAMGMSVVVGATNILMGRSHSNNLSALEAIQNGCADILVSDYFPAAILHAIFLLYERGVLSLPQAVGMATLNPAKAVKIDAYQGSIEPGKYADLLLVSKKGPVPVILSTYINGEEVTRIHYRNDQVAQL